MIIDRHEAHDLIADLLKLKTRAPITTRILRELEYVHEGLGEGRRAEITVSRKRWPSDAPESRAGGRRTYRRWPR